MLIKINWSKILDGMAWISCGYGVRPRYTVFLSCILIILFALLFWMGDGIVVEPLNGDIPSIAPPKKTSTSLTISTSAPWSSQPRRRLNGIQ
jgi:hypothetical protein